MERCTAEVFELHVLMQIIFMNKGPKLLIFGSTKKKGVQEKKMWMGSAQQNLLYCREAGKLYSSGKGTLRPSVRPSGERTR